MIGIYITIIAVLIISMGIIQRNINKNRKRIKELEERLEEYYNKRENRLLKKFKDIEQQ
jgi:uncharacterized membrane protein (DUF106 family)